MALSDLQSNIADEISRTDLSTQITREISNAITFYQNKGFWFNRDQMVTITTINGQRYYSLPANFASIYQVRAKLNNVTYNVDIYTESYLDSIDWTDTSVTNYIQGVSFFSQRLRIYPPPTAGIPVYLKGTVLLPTLTTTAATKTYTKNTAYSKNDTVTDSFGNIQTCVTAGTTGAAATKPYTANTAYSVNDTVLDLNGNTQTCTVGGTSGYQAAVDSTQWATNANALTIDGTVTWQLTTQQWSTTSFNPNYDGYTVDGSVVWQLTTALTNAWMVQAEELIRTRTIHMLYRRYIKDIPMAREYEAMERSNLLNLYEKNIGQSTGARLSPHL